MRENNYLLFSLSQTLYTIELVTTLHLTTQANARLSRAWLAFDQWRPEGQLPAAARSLPSTCLRCQSPKSRSSEAGLVRLLTTNDGSGGRPLGSPTF